VADDDLAEIEARIARLPPLSRDAGLASQGLGQAGVLRTGGTMHPLGGPDLHARRLAHLWRVADDADVGIEWAFRLLSPELIRDAIVRVMSDPGWDARVACQPSDPRYWVFPDFCALRPILDELARGAMLRGELVVRIVGGQRRRWRTLSAAELARLHQEGRAVLLGARVRRPSTQAHSAEEIERAVLAVASQHPGKKPAFERVLWPALKHELGDACFARRGARKAFDDYAPQILRSRPGAPRSRR
jgi:hypothetical protein